MKHNYIILTVLLVLISLSSCKKQVDETYQPLVFHSLVATDQVFPPGETTTLHADVTGTQVIYNWSYNSGTLIGGGDQVTYSNVQPGIYKVICTVIDGAGEVEAKEIMLSVQ